MIMKSTYSECVVFVEHFNYDFNYDGFLSCMILSDWKNDAQIWVELGTNNATIDELAVMSRVFCNI